MSRERSMVMRLVVVIVIGAASACSSGSPSATPPAAPTTPVIMGDSPVAQLRVLIDYGTVALSDVQAVTFDGSGSTGVDLHYRVDYGDRTFGIDSVRPSLARPGVFFHAYAAPPGQLRSFLTRLTVTDRYGRSATADATVLVRDVTGVWRSTIVNPTSRRTETRALTLTQIGSRVTGAYTHPEGYSEFLTGLVDSPRTVKLALDAQTIRFEGLDLDGTGLNETVTAMTVAVTGGTADGLRVTFTRQ